MSAPAPEDGESSNVAIGGLIDEGSSEPPATASGLGEATENPLNAAPVLEEVRTATVYENQRYHKRRLTWGPVRSGLDPVPVFGSGPHGNHFIPWQWSSDPRTDPTAHVRPNVDLSAPWQWADKDWATDEHWEYATSWGCAPSPPPHRPRVTISPYFGRVA